MYHVSSLCYDLFYEIEMSVYEKLQDQFTSKIKSTIEDIKRIAYNMNRIWANCSVSMPINSGEILHDMVHLRGHSLTSEYMEQYKEQYMEQKNYQNKLLSCMGVEYNQPAHLLDRYIKGGDINGGRLYFIGVGTWGG